MQIRRLLAASLACVAMTWTASAKAQLEPTTEFGITVTPQMIFDAIQESQEFWPSVQKHVVSNEFAVAEPAVRGDAVKFLKKVDGRLSELLFSSDQTQAKDLIDFLSGRLRKFEIYRRIRSTVGDDALAARLKQDFEQARRDVYRLPEAEQAAAKAKQLEHVRTELAAAKLSDEKSAEAMKQWELASQVLDKMHHSSVGKVMAELEDEVRAGDPQVRALLISVLRAADWAMISRADAKPVRATQFVAAWESLLQFDKQQASKQATGAKL